MNSAVRRLQWQQAWEVSEAVLAEHGDDAEVIAAVAQVAHHNNKPEAAAELLVRACRAESFQSESRVQQAMIAMIAVGRLYDGMEMLEEAVGMQPTHDETRRWLYDFYMGTENRAGGIPHGRFLVRRRKFDLELLVSLSNTERRTQDSEPLDEMTSRNPDDRRPLLGGAKTNFDLGDYDQSIQTLRSIVDKHPEYLPAQALLGRGLAAAGQFGEFEQWANDQQPSIEKYVDYWLAVGDWSRSKGRTQQAARAYWEATVRDVDVMESWSKLSTSLQQLSAAEVSIAPSMLESVARRASQLTTFNQRKRRFNRTGSISRALAIDVVDALRDLGRLWEAEAWASLAMSLPEDDAVDVVAARDAVVAMLSEDTPWQLTDGFPELKLDLSNLALPSIGQRSDSTGPLMAAESAQGRRLDGLQLLNEATSRGLVFFGRTGEDLNRSGIMLYQTLGCGGGAIDYDLDGWPDLYLAAAGGTPPAADSATNVLLRNLGGIFADVTGDSQTTDTRFGQGIAVGDVNEDGFPDLLALNYGPNTLLINNGDGSFTDTSEKLAANGDYWSASAAIADIDADGLGDIVVVNYCAGLQPITKTCLNKDYGKIFSCSPMAFAAQPDHFLRSGGDGAFHDSTADWQAEPTVAGRGLGIVAGSFDNRPGLDIFIANDMTNNHFWSPVVKDGRVLLAETAMPLGLGANDRAMAQGSMGIATGDFDRDGDIDFYVTNFQGEYNIYHDGVGGAWRDETSGHKLSESTIPLVGFGSEAADLENDGTLELMVANGHVDVFPRADQYAKIVGETLYEQPLQIFRRNDSRSFDSIAPSLRGQYTSTSHVGRALWTLDANRDGLTDFVVTHQTEPVALLINHSHGGGNWIELSLRGRSCSRDAIGAVVKLTCGDQNWIAAVTSGDGYLCSNQRVVHVGIGEAAGDCDVTVNWPDGTSQSHPGLPVNSRWLLIQSDEQAFEQD